MFTTLHAYFSKCRRNVHCFIFWGQMLCVLVIMHKQSILSKSKVNLFKYLVYLNIYLYGRLQYCPFCMCMVLTSWAESTLHGNGRSGCKPIPRCVLAGYIIPLNLGRCNVSVTINATSTRANSAKC